MTDKRPKRPRDANQLAKLVIDIAAGDDTVTDLNDEEDKAKAMRRGKARAAALTPEQRKVIAKVAAQTRWKKSR